jgi:hypothetical protein
MSRAADGTAAGGAHGAAVTPAAVTFRAAAPPQEAAKGTTKRISLAGIQGVSSAPLDVNIPAGVDSGQTIQARVSVWGRAGGSFRGQGAAGWGRGKERRGGTRLLCLAGKPPLEGVVQAGSAFVMGVTRGLCDQGADVAPVPTWGGPGTLLRARARFPRKQ